MRSEFDNKLHYDSERFNTVNHYLQDNYMKNFQMSDDLAEKITNELQGSKNLYNDYGDSKERMQKYINSQLTSHMQQFLRKDLQEQQKFNVFCGVKAYMKVVQKTITDNAQSCIRRGVIEPAFKWRDDLSENNYIRNAARENNAIIVKRAKNRELVAKMENCKKILAEGLVES